MAEVRRFLRETYAARPPNRLTPQDDRGAILTLRDIADALKLHYDGLRFHTRPHVPASCTRGCRSMDECHNCAARWMNPGLRVALVRFLRRWQSGELRKARGPRGWQLIDLSHGAPPLPPLRERFTQPLGLKIDRTTLKLKVT
jgi:hypothetical protein